LGKLFSFKFKGLSLSKIMLESRPEDALGSLVLTVFIILTILTAMAVLIVLTGLTVLAVLIVLTVLTVLSVLTDKFYVI